MMTQPATTYTEKNETGCCPIPSLEGWDGATFQWDNKLFVRDRTVSIMHIPLNFGAMIRRIIKQIEDARAMPPRTEWMLLSHDSSPWRGEHLAAVTKEVPGADNVRLSGAFITKVFEGPYKDARNWYTETKQYVESQGKELQKMYFFYTTCPKCAKHYGKNYVIAFAQVK